jgi:hypothetical protein
MLVADHAGPTMMARGRCDAAASIGTPSGRINRYYGDAIHFN